tara:strand:- start:2455 stop:2838 length:384 start_codon:yes stop_codon:yes gene_type:complete
MLHANSITPNLDNKENIILAKESHTAHAYKWNIETEIGAFTGTCLSIDEVNDEIAMLTNNAKVLKKNIIPMSIIFENEEDKIYSWNVITNTGQASGISTSLEEVQRVVNLFGTTEMVKFNMAEPFTT